jgi:hypothetical protein
VFVSDAPKYTDWICGNCQRLDAFLLCYEGKIESQQFGHSCAHCELKKKILDFRLTVNEASSLTGSSDHFFENKQVRSPGDLLMCEFCRDELSVFQVMAHQDCDDVIYEVNTCNGKYMCHSCRDSLSEKDMDDDERRILDQIKIGVNKHLCQIDLLRVCLDKLAKFIIHGYSKDLYDEIERIQTELDCLVDPCKIVELFGDRIYRLGQEQQSSQNVGEQVGKNRSDSSRSP